MGTAKRFKANMISEIQVHGQEGNLLGFMRNVSSSGALLEIFEGDYVPQRGDILHISNEIQDLDAEVVWSRSEGFGVCFLDRAELQERLMNRTSFALA